MGSTTNEGGHGGVALEAAKPSVLLVDDSQDNREVYAEFLAGSGFMVEEAADGEEALEKAVALRPSLVIMDLTLPGLDGWETTRRLRKDPRTRHVPVVAVTGHATAEDSSSARQAGCNAFLAKPFLPDMLIAEIRRLLGTP